MSHPEISSKQVTTARHSGSVYNRPQVWGVEVVCLGLIQPRPGSQLPASGAIACPADIILEIIQENRWYRNSRGSVFRHWVLTIEVREFEWTEGWSEMQAVCVIRLLPVGMRHLSPQLLWVLASDDSNLIPSRGIYLSRRCLSLLTSRHYYKIPKIGTFWKEKIYLDW